MTDDDLAKLEAAAKVCAERIESWGLPWETARPREEPGDDAIDPFVDAASPATVLELVERCRKAEAEVEELYERFHVVRGEDARRMLDDLNSVPPRSEEWMARQAQAAKGFSDYMQTPVDQRTGMKKPAALTARRAAYTKPRCRAQHPSGAKLFCDLEKGHDTRALPGHSDGWHSVETTQCGRMGWAPSVAVPIHDPHDIVDPDDG